MESSEPLNKNGEPLKKLSKSDVTKLGLLSMLLQISYS